MKHVSIEQLKKAAKILRKKRKINLTFTTVAGPEDLFTVAYDFDEEEGAICLQEFFEILVEVKNGKN